MQPQNKKYDVVILGSGIGGSMLACILAKNGISTLLLEELSHPRFTIGESLIPETGVRLRIIAEKYGVPEIGWIGSFHALRDNVSSNCGVKRSFSFMYHRPGERHRAEEVNQLPTLTPPLGPDSHLFRQDTDAYLAAISVKYGAEFRQQAKITHIEFGSPDAKDGEVRLTTANNEVIRASFLIDGGGMRSQVSTQLGLRDATPRFRTDTRTLYSHFMGVKPADLLFEGERHRMPSPLGQATMHHIFDGGWMWIIPFNNHRDATNPLTSVGMMLDRRRHPTPQGPPEQEFRDIIRRYPTIAQHFAEAKAVRPWVGSGRLQYSQQHLLGPRVLQLPHAASFVDPLYSSGMSVLTVAVDLIAEALLEAVAVNDFAIERFQRMEDVVNAGFNHYDQIVSTSFDAFASYELWNAWNRNWAMGNYMGTWGPLALLLRYFQTGDRSLLARTCEPGRIGVLSSHIQEIREAMKSSADDVAEAVSGRVPPAEASARIFARLGALEFLPPYMGFGRSEQRAPASFTLPAGARHVLWYRYRADPKWKEYANFSLLTYARGALGFVLTQSHSAAQRATAALRDVFFADNDEWRYTPNALQAHGRLNLPPPPPPQEVAELESEVAQLAK
jgi:tetracycline 7-halogenase / FADH2 O2-dependent halogenase